MGFLTDVVARVRAELEQRPLNEGSLLLRTRALPEPRDFLGAVEGSEMSIIAELKRASPSAGAIADADPGRQASRYERGGAAAVSVLTEPRYFDGSLSDLRAVRRHVELPLLRKDFIVHPSQVIESRAEGADAILLIAAALTTSELLGLRELAEELGLVALVEAHGEEDLERAIESGSRLVGVNARDLETLDVDLDRALRLARTVPDDRVVVVESGIASRRDVVAAADAGARAVLVGEALMRAGDPEVAIRRLRGSLVAVTAKPDGPTR